MIRGPVSNRMREEAQALSNRAVQLLKDELGETFGDALPDKRLTTATTLEHAVSEIEAVMAALRQVKEQEGSHRWNNRRAVDVLRASIRDLETWINVYREDVHFNDVSIVEELLTPLTHLAREEIEGEPHSMLPNVRGERYWEKFSTTIDETLRQLSLLVTRLSVSDYIAHRE